VTLPMADRARLIVHPVSLAGHPTDTALDLPGGNTPSAHFVRTWNAVNVDLVFKEQHQIHIHAERERARPGPEANPGPGAGTFALWAAG